MPPTYGTKDLKRIADAVNRSPSDLSRFEHNLEEAALWFRFRRREPRRITPSQLERRLKSISSHAQKLLRGLGIEEPANAIDGPNDPAVLQALTSSDGPNEDDVLVAAERIECLSELLSFIQASWDLDEWAKAAVERSRKVRKPITPDGHTGDWATNEWIASMMEIYEALTETNARTSVGGLNNPNEGVATGPLIRFLLAAQVPIGLKFDSDALRSRVRTLLVHASDKN